MTLFSVVFFSVQPLLPLVLQNHMDCHVQGAIEFIRPIHHEEMIRAFQDNGVEEGHVTSVGFIINRPHITVHRDDRPWDIIKNLGRLSRNVL